MYMEFYGFLFELFEKIIIELLFFSDNCFLQSLMFFIVIKNDKGKVMGYINKFLGYDVEIIVKVVIEVGFYEEVFIIYQKYDMYVEVMSVFVEYMVFID